jgi:hypothetical protein
MFHQCQKLASSKLVLRMIFMTPFKLQIAKVQADKTLPSRFRRVEEFIIKSAGSFFSHIILVIIVQINCGFTPLSTTPNTQSVMVAQLISVC